MALRLTSRAGQLNYFGFRTSILSQAFHNSGLSLKTHDYDAMDYTLPAQKFQDFVKNPESLAIMRKKSGAVIRRKFSNDIEVLEENSANLLIVGSSYQIRKAVEQLQSIVNGADITKDDIVVHKELPNKLVWHGYKRNYKGQ